MQDGDISSMKFHKALQNAEEYWKLNANIGNQAKTIGKQITKEQHEQLLE